MGRRFAVWFAVALGLACLAPETFASPGHKAHVSAVRANAGHAITVAGPERGKQICIASGAAVLDSLAGLEPGLVLRGPLVPAEHRSARFRAVACNGPRAPPLFLSSTF
ncbi:MAG: hypothetical protein SGI92_23485 [Bryobacteraceae bacterium]|nr:hypothetical protein [Bryobacteraceae bacterium]